MNKRSASLLGAVLVLCGALTLPISNHSALASVPVTRVIFDGGSLTTTDLGTWGGLNTQPMGLTFDFTRGPTTITVLGIDLSDIHYEGPWAWPPVPADQGAQARFGVSGSGFWSRHQIHSAIGGGSGSWDAQATPWTHDNGFRKYLIQNQWSGVSAATTLGNHQYNAEAFIPRTGAGAADNDPEHVTDRDYNTFDMRVTYTPTDPSTWVVSGQVRLHKASSWTEMNTRPGDPVWGSAFTWQWNKAINNCPSPDAAWVPFYDGTWSVSGDLTSVEPFMEIINWGAPQTEPHTFSWDSLAVDGYPVAPSEVWVDDNWTGTPQGTHLGDGKYYGYNAFSTIQNAANAVAADGTVDVAPGLYPEALVISTSGVTFVGDPGDATPGPGGDAPVLDGSGFSGRPAINLAPGVSGVTIEGFEICNYLAPPVPGNPTDSNAILAWNAGTSDITIQDNYMHDLGYAGVLIGNGWGGGAGRAHRLDRDPQRHQGLRGVRNRF